MLAGILVIAAIPRLWAITDVGLRGDEAVYAGQAAVLAGDDELDRYFVLASRGNSNFLFYQQVVALFYLIFGVSDVAARLVAIGFSLGTVLVCFGIGKTLYGRNVGLLAALFVALSGYSVLLGRLALLDSTLVFLFSLALLCFAKWITTSRNVWLYAFAACTALTIQAKVTGVLVLVIALNYLLVSKELRRLSIRRFLLASGDVPRVLHPGDRADRAEVRPAGRVPRGQRAARDAGPVALLPRQARSVSRAGSRP